MHYQVMAIMSPENLKLFFSALAKIVFLDPFDIEEFLIKTFQFKNTGPLMPNFTLLNYNDKSFIRNISFNSVWLIALPTIFLLITLIERCAK
jgi:hypothetical protein